MAPVQDVDPTDISSSGWGVIFGPDVDGDIRDALQPLLEHRREQASRIHDQYYQEYSYQTGDSAASFLNNYRAGPGPANPHNE